MHTDVNLLPRRRRAWASWNYHLLDQPTDRTTVTYHMNRLQSLRAEREFCVTLNRTSEIAPEKVIRTISYAHPVFTTPGVVAQSRVAEISGQNRTHFCGPTGAGGFTRTAWPAPYGWANGSGRDCESGRGDHQLHLRGRHSPPALRDAAR